MRTISLFFSCIVFSLSATPYETGTIYGLYWLTGAVSQTGVNTISEPARRMVQKYINTISYINTNEFLDLHKPDTCYTATCALLFKSGILFARTGFHAKELMYPQQQNTHRTTQQDIFCYCVGIGWGFTLAYFLEPYIETLCKDIEMTGLRNYSSYHVTWQALPTIIPPVTTWLLQKATAHAVGWDAPQKQVALENGMNLGIDIKDAVSDPQITSGANALVSGYRVHTLY